MAGHLLSREDLSKPLDLRCAKCGGKAKAYHDGTYCPKCSPSWIGSFLEYLHEEWLKGAFHA